MEKKETKGLLVQVYNLLSTAKLDKCDMKERIDIIKALRSVRHEVEAFRGFVSEVQEKNGDVKDAALIAELDKAIADEANKVIETADIAPLTEDAIMHLLDSNEMWNAAIVMGIEDIFKK